MLNGLLKWSFLADDALDGFARVFATPNAEGVGRPRRP